MSEPGPEEILEAAWSSLWGQPVHVPFEEGAAFLYWETYPEGKEKMGVHRAIGYVGPRPVAEVTSRWYWVMAYKVLKADVRAHNEFKARMRGDV